MVRMSDDLVAIHGCFSVINELLLGRHLEYIEIFNDATVASLVFFLDYLCTTRINKFNLKFQVLSEFAQIQPDYNAYLCSLVSVV